MRIKINPGIHFILFIIVAIVFFTLEERIRDDSLAIIAIGIFLLVTGLWGNIAKMVLLNVPSGLKTYRIINYILIIFGVLCILYGSCKYFFISPS